MSTKQQTLAGYLCRWACATICAIAVVAVVFHLRRDWFESIRSAYPKSMPSGDRQNPTPAELIATIDERLTQERDRVSTIQDSLAQFRSLRDSLQSQVKSADQAVADRRVELVKYAEYINADEGAVLASGELVSATALRNRAVTRRNELAEVTQKLDRIGDFATRVESMVTELEQLLNHRLQDIDELTDLRAGLAEKATLLAHFETESDKSNQQTTSLLALRDSVQRTQDAIDVKLQMIEEETSIEQGLWNAGSD